VIADLLQAHQRREHEAAPLDALAGRELLGEIVDRLLIERRLAPREVAPRVELGLVG